MTRQTPECDTKEQITWWLTLNNFRVFWEQKNPYNYTQFKTEGSRKKPDLLFQNIQNPKCCGAIEVKTANTDNNMRSSHKIVQYYHEYATEKIKYFLYDQEVKLRYFLVASPQSINGHLYSYEQTIPQHNDEIIQKKRVPPIEYCTTYEYFRSLSPYWTGKQDKIDKRKPQLLLGILLSTKISLQNIEPPKPTFFVWVPFISKKYGTMTSTHYYLDPEDFLKEF